VDAHRRDFPVARGRLVHGRDGAAELRARAVPFHVEVLVLVDPTPQMALSSDTQVREDSANRGAGPMGEKPTGVTDEDQEGYGRRGRSQ
jgi:hypothetical protein